MDGVGCCSRRTWRILGRWTAWNRSESIGRFMRTSSEQGEGALRVMTYNIRHGRGNDTDTRGEAGKQFSKSDFGLDLGRIAAVIRSVNPDIVALQEVDRFWSRSAGQDQPAALAAMLQMDVCYGANMVLQGDADSRAPREYGVATLTRHPIRRSRNTLLPVPEGWEPRGLLEAHVHVAGVGEVLVLNTHFQVGRQGLEQEAVQQRLDQARAAVERIRESSVPVVLMGDFNADPSAEEMAPFRAANIALSDAWEVAGDGGAGLTNPAHPDVPAAHRIDAILVTSEFSIAHAEVLDNVLVRMASDHFPVVAELGVST
jgi:endonuclease/exonuclease/phosphatase family metal-dependent hydrolase